MGFKTADQLQKRFGTTRDIVPTPKPKKRGRPPKNEEKKIPETIPLTEEEIKEKKELIDIILDEKQEIPLEKLIKNSLIEDDIIMPTKKGATTTARTAASPVNGIKKMLEDVYTIEELRDLISGRRKAKEIAAQQATNPEIDDNDDLMAMIPLIKQLQNQENNPQSQNQSGGLDLNTMLLMQILGSNKKTGNSAMNQMLMFTLLGNMQNSTPQNNTMNIELLKLIMNMMAQQQQQQPGIDTNTLTLLSTILGNNKQASQRNPDIDRLLIKFEQMQQNDRDRRMEMIMNQSDNKFSQALEMVAGAMQSNPKKDLMEAFDMFNKFSGEKRNRTKDELEYDLKKHELNLKEQERKNEIDREERRLDREESKSENFLNNVNNIADKLIPSGGIAELLGSVMSSRTPKRSNRDINDELGGLSFEDLEDL